MVGVTYLSPALAARLGLGGGSGDKGARNGGARGGGGYACGNRGDAPSLDSPSPTPGEPPPTPCETACEACKADWFGGLTQNLLACSKEYSASKKFTDGIKNPDQQACYVQKYLCKLHHCQLVAQSQYNAYVQLCASKACGSRGCAPAYPRSTSASAAKLSLTCSKIEC